MNQSTSRLPDQTRLAALERHYWSALLDDVIPFWEKHSPDREAGGYYSCLERNGKVFDTDKFIWLQGREAWMFSLLYNTVEKKESWLAMAQLGMQFLRAHGMDGGGNWYFAVSKDGDPLIQPFSIFSDCFAAMAFGQFSIATGDQAAASLAVDTFRNIRRRSDNPLGVYSKAVPWSRPMRSYALPMILSNLALQLDAVVPPREIEETIDEAVAGMTNLFLDRERGIFHEHVAPDGSHPDSFDGRLVNPGHGIEGTWFLMDIAERRHDKDLMNIAVDTLLSTIQFGWDSEHGGIFYFMDALQKPPQQLEWDQKLWWVHLETLVALLKAFHHTRRPECWSWFERVHEYSWNHFADPEFGEWFGYLNREGRPLLTLKGGKWKGCFHVPRALLLCAQTLKKLQAS